MSTLQPDEVDYVIYHHPCTDGFGSAFVAWKYLSTRFPDRPVTYYPASIGAPPPNDVIGRNVLICDYSYRKTQLAELIGKVKKLLILDHHKSAQKELVDLPDQYKVFDMNQSGAVLTWKFFFPQEPVPRLIEYIQDRDLWTNRLPNIDKFAAWFWIQPFDFNVFNDYLDAGRLETMITTHGAAFVELNNYYITQARNSVAIRFTKIHGKFYVVGYINSSVLKSDIGNRIVTDFPQLDFAAIYTVDDQAGVTRFSLRSSDTQADVSEIATSLSGGGHRNAAGVVVTGITNHLTGQIYEFNHLYERLQKITMTPLTIPDLGTYNVFYLHSTVHKGKLTKYLVQPKSGPNSISVARSLLQQSNDRADWPDALAVVWDYDPLDDQTTFVVAFAPKLPPQVVQHISQFLKLDSTLQVVHPGCHRILPV
jgi:oligoribonuclease NrnB/cAMP/cGMP phosphodiesterase (DHH superfamily)